jgi:hypothetical protein
MSFRITAVESGKARLVSSERLHASDFRPIAAELLVAPVRARKSGYVAARRAVQREIVETRWNGVETNNIAHPGDWIVTSLTPQQRALRDAEGRVNAYVLFAETFAKLYEPTAGLNHFGAIYRPQGKVPVLAVSFPGGFDILLINGERQRAPSGYLLLNSDVVYGDNAQTFEATYELLADWVGLTPEHPISRVLLPSAAEQEEHP